MVKKSSDLYKYFFIMVVLLGGLYFAFPEKVDKLVSEKALALIPGKKKNPTTYKDPFKSFDPGSSLQQPSAASKVDTGLDYDPELTRLESPKRPKLSPDQASSLIAILRNDDYTATQKARAQAVTDLGNCGPTTTALILPLLANRDSYTVRGALNALGSIRQVDKKAWQAVLKKAENQDLLVRTEAARALGLINLGPAQSVPALLKLLAEDDKLLRDAATLALARCHSTALPYLTDALDNPQYKNIRVGILNALGMMHANAKPANVAINMLAQDFDSNVRLAAENAYKQINAQ